MSDDSRFGHHAVEDIVAHSDWLATVLQQFGLDRTKLALKRNARDMTPTEGAVVEKILA